MYARTLLDCATANADGRARALVVGGGIANFTDVAATFKGIIQVCILQSALSRVCTGQISPVSTQLFLIQGNQCSWHAQLL